MKHLVTAIFSSSILLTAIISGCGGETDGTSSGGTGTTEVAFEALPGETAKYYCSLAYSCCDMMELTQLFQDLGGAPASEAECVPKMQMLYETNVFADLKASVMAGRQAYDGKKAAACYDAIKGQCSAIKGDIFETDPNCQTVFVGKVADGGECSMGDDCAGADSICAGATQTMMGKCQVAPKEGEACPDFVCADGLECSFAAMNQVCVKPYVKADGQMCASSVECTSHFCDSMAGTCAAQKAIGAMCLYSDECKDSYCESSTNVCTAKKAVGETCAFFDECASDDCDFMKMVCVAANTGPACDGI